MNGQITEDQYKKEVKNFIGLSIDRVNVLFEPNLLVGGFSLIHIADNEKKWGSYLEYRVVCCTKIQS